MTTNGASLRRINEPLDLSMGLRRLPMSKIYDCKRFYALQKKSLQKEYHTILSFYTPQESMPSNVSFRKNDFFVEGVNHT